MDTRVHQGRVLEFNERNMVIRVHDEKLGKEVEIHWTSYWSEVPGRPPSPDEIIELVYNGTEAAPRLLAARPRKEGE